jgi:hypothetical protein
LPFLFLPNANLNPDFQTCIAFGEVSKPPHVSSYDQRKDDVRQFLQCDYTTLCLNPHIIYDPTPQHATYPPQIWRCSTPWVVHVAKPNSKE